MGNHHFRLSLLAQFLGRRKLVIWKPSVAGSSPATFYLFTIQGDVAQLAEHLPCYKALQCHPLPKTSCWAEGYWLTASNRVVAGSSPAVSSAFTNI